MAQTEKKKAPKPKRIKCKGGPAKELRIEGNLEPLDKVPYASGGHYRLVTSSTGMAYQWVGKS